jgi:hypothetical protein
MQQLPQLGHLFRELCGPSPLCICGSDGVGAAGLLDFEENRVLAEFQLALVLT